MFLPIRPGVGLSFCSCLMDSSSCSRTSGAAGGGVFSLLSFACEKIRKLIEICCFFGLSLKVVIFSTQCAQNFVAQLSVV